MGKGRYLAQLNNYPAKDQLKPERPMGMRLIRSDLWNRNEHPLASQILAFSRHPDFEP